MPLREIPLHQSAVRPIFMLGADRILVAALGVIVAFFLLVLPWTWQSLSVSALLVFVGYPVLVKLCKHDPQWRRVMLRAMWYQSYYPPAGSTATERRKPFPSIPEPKDL